MASKTITLRVPDDVLEAFDEKVIAAGTNRTETIVSFMRTAAGLVDPPRPGAARAPRCKHPHDKLRVHTWGTMCGECNARVA